MGRDGWKRLYLMKGCRTMDANVGDKGDAGNVDKVGEAGDVGDVDDVGDVGDKIGVELTATMIDRMALDRTVIDKRYQHADQLLGKRWVMLIIGSLLRRPCRFSEIGAYIGLVSDRTLSVRLGELEAHGIIERRVDSEAKPVRIDYALTPKGRALEPIVRETARWADSWLDEVESRKSKVESRNQ